MNRCIVCTSQLLAAIDAEARRPRANTTAIARRYGIDRQSLGRHIRNGHVVPFTPATVVISERGQEFDVSTEYALEASQWLASLTDRELTRVGMDPADAEADLHAEIAEEFGLTVEEVAEHARHMGRQPVG